MATPLPITDRPVRVAIVGLGTVSELVLPPYLGRDDVEIVGLCDPDPARRARWGAVWPDAASVVLVSRTEHWAFKAPARPALPAPANRGWIRTPIDAYVLARLEKEGLTPAPEADKATLLRRLSLDLTGLPPTPEEVDVFVQASLRTPHSALHALLDRLLASPRYGERMAARWLDAAHQLDDDVRLGIGHDVGRRVGQELARQTVAPRPGDIADRDGDDVDGRAIGRHESVRMVEQALEDGATHRARAEHGDAQRRSAHRWGW